MNYQDLSDLIIKRFTPFAFTCECKGAHPECARTRSEDTYAIAQNDTVSRIADFINKLDKE